VGYNPRGIQASKRWVTKKSMERCRVEFCTECGSILKPLKVNSGKQAMFMLACTKCGLKKQDPDANGRFNGKIIEHSPKQFVAVIGREEQELHTLPTIRIECPKCGNNTANVWQVQTRGSDESSTQFMRCLRCGFTYREST
jgi:DNA-directed RNA polymerase subunit M